MKDPIVEEVRQIRLKIEQDCVMAGISYKNHLLAVQKQYESRLVSPPNSDTTKRVAECA
jgi:hypothetical protein